MQNYKTFPFPAIFLPILTKIKDSVLRRAINEKVLSYREMTGLFLIWYAV